MLTEFKFTTTKTYILLNKDYIFRELKQKIKRLKKEFDLKKSARYFTQKVNFNKFLYIEKVLQQEKESFNSKN